MAMEKRSLAGSTVDVRSVAELIKYASDEGRIVVLNMDGFMKTAEGRNRHALVILATGENADKLRDALGPLLEE